MRGPIMEADAMKTLFTLAALAAVAALPVSATANTANEDLPKGEAKLARMLEGRALPPHGWLICPRPCGHPLEAQHARVEDVPRIKLGLDRAQ